MSNPSCSQLYYLQPNHGVSLITAHLFEHAFIHKFHDYAIDTGHNPDATTDIRGETFDDTIFIYNVSNNQLGNKLLDDFIKSDNIRITDEELNRALLQISVEDETKYIIANRNELNSQIQQMSQIGFQTVDELGTFARRTTRQEYGSNDTVKFADCLTTSGKLPTKVATVNYILDSNSVNDWVIFANMFSLLTFATSRSLAKVGAYYLCDVVETENVDGRQVIVGGIDYAVSKSCNLDDIHELVGDVLDSNPASTNPGDLQSYLDQEYTPAGLIHDYQSVGILESWSLLKQLLTIQNFSNIWQKIQIYSVDESPRG